MRFKIGLIMFLLSGTACFSQKKAILLKITYRAPYCGGARPSDEMKAEAEKDRPFAKKRVILVSINGKADTLKTSASGTIKLKLKPGTYKLFETWRYYKIAPPGLAIKDVNQECIKAEWQKPISIIEVDAKKAACSPANEILIYCPWAIPCILETAMPPMPQ